MHFCVSEYTWLDINKKSLSSSPDRTSQANIAQCSTTRYLRQIKQTLATEEEIGKRLTCSLRPSAGIEVVLETVLIAQRGVILYLCLFSIYSVISCREKARSVKTGMLGYLMCRGALINFIGFFFLIGDGWGF